MATQFATMPAHAHARPTPTLKTEHFDMDTFIDFNQAGPSPTTASSNIKNDITPKHDWSPFDQSEDQQQQFNPPSHDYNQYKQQVGLPVGSLSAIPQNGMFDSGYGSGFDMGMNSGFDAYGSGLDMDSEMNMDFGQQQQGAAMPAMFYPTQRHNSQASDFVNPNTIGGQEETPSNVGRLWPGMHSQQAAMQKQMMQQQQQRQMKMQAFQQQQNQQAAAAAGSSQQSQRQQTPQQAPANGKRASHVSEPHVEESITRLLNQMRQNSHVSMGSDDADTPGGVLPHIARMRKDEEEMDEDERLLASDEGKKLSSKERRQLRNKVSARAFRSRRKEYISQLEGDIAMKAQENQTLRNENNSLASENERYRGLIETLLRHPAFHPFIDDISKNPATLGMMPAPADGMQMQPSAQPTPTPVQQAPQQQQQQQKQQSQPEMSFETQQSSQSVPRQQQTQQVGLTMVPEENFSKLNINGFGPAVNFNHFQSVNAYPVTSMPAQPNHVDLIADHMPTDSFFSASDSSFISAKPAELNVLLAKLDRTAVKSRN